MLAAAREAGAWDESLADLSVLVDGFIELGRGAASPRRSRRPSSACSGGAPTEAVSRPR